MNSISSPFPDPPGVDMASAELLSVALIGPDEQRRNAASAVLTQCLAGRIREFSDYPPDLDRVPWLLEQNHDVVVIDLDSNQEYALELVERISVESAVTVMVYSAKTDPGLLVRCMRAGAREFLTLPFSSGTMAEALARASARRPASRSAKKEDGALLVFLGAKGGAGVTTVASNFAVALAQESGKSTVLIDLDLPLGDAALNLGIVAEYSTVNALQDFSRLDSSFFSKLLIKHSSGVSVLAAPGRFPQFQASSEAIDKLIAVARQDFENVVVDIGSRLDMTDTVLFKGATTVYLITETSIPGLRNANRLIAQLFSANRPKLEIVINRYESRPLGVTEEHITKALTRTADWKIPNDFAAVRQMQNTATPLALADSPIARKIRQMARSALGQPPVAAKKKGFSLFG